MAATAKATLTNHVASTYNKNADFVYSAAFTSPVLGLLNAQPGETICDLGCGSGELTETICKIVEVDGEVWGLDSSASMLDAARKRCPDVRFVQVDAQEIPTTLDPSLKGKFDVVFSSAVLHWCKRDPAGVIDGVKWLLKPGGRFVWEMGGFGNVVGVRGSLHDIIRRRGLDPLDLDPWYFPTAKQYKSVLEERGMRVEQIDLVPRPTPLTTDLRGWLETFARRTFLASFTDKDSAAVMDEVVELCRPDNFWSMECPGVGVASSDPGESGWNVMYVRLRGVAYA